MAAGVPDHLRRIACLLVLNVTLGLTLAGCGGAGPEGAQVSEAADDVTKPGPLGDRSLGRANAPVTVVEYASLTCPHCRAFHENVFPKLKRNYIDTGKVRYVVREFPIGRSAGNAAIINRCAPADKYFQLYGLFLDNQREWVSQEVRLDAIYGVAKRIGMTRAQFDNCLANQSIIDALDEQKQRGRRLGVKGTPTFFVNGQKAQGTVTYEEIKRMIESRGQTGGAA
ncbi:Disulfide bond formation protein D precursor [Methyloligella halotolerans]|uniref:Disulfide bond formation protein D n=1 Tax=Methyloligella halotolerans TaxID=1177755 RepID=A0A1E2RYE9_9HYPH|nr:DsbA family protein [Methyloligella halotolerans]ODA67253.1 Disulfide bond formation protein D precursor [Methyloligella halotolerans]